MVKNFMIKSRPFSNQKNNFKKKENKSIDLSKPAIKVSGYTKKFRSFLSTKDVSFEVNHGTIHGFIGPNGSGKTTTIKALIGAYRPTKGELLINGHECGTKKANKLIGYIPERASFPKHLNTIAYLTAMGEISGLNKKTAKTKAIEVLTNLDFMDFAKRKPITFSSGMQKKILLAQSLLTDPSVLILDEPAANLDPSARQELFEELKTFKSMGKTVFISSHILSELERIVDEISFIYEGDILYSGTVEKFIKKGNSVFIKTSNNKKLMDFLDQTKRSYIASSEYEVQVTNINTNGSSKLYAELSKQDFIIISFRTNDLQTAYDALIAKSHLKKLREEKAKIKANSLVKGKAIRMKQVYEAWKTVRKARKRQ